MMYPVVTFVNLICTSSQKITLSYSHCMSTRPSIQVTTARSRWRRTLANNYNSTPIQSDWCIFGQYRGWIANQTPNTYQLMSWWLQEQQLKANHDCSHYESKRLLRHASVKRTHHFVAGDGEVAVAQDLRVTDSADKVRLWRLVHGGRCSGAVAPGNWCRVAASSRSTGLQQQTSHILQYTRDICWIHRQNW